MANINTVNVGGTDYDIKGKLKLIETIASTSSSTITLTNSLEVGKKLSYYI